jgi:outer membrane receptor protein involved in Fe transport
VVDWPAWKVIIKPLRTSAIVAVIGITGLSLAPPGAADPAASYGKMSLEELLQTRIEVGSLETETIFNTPSTVSVISRETILRYNFMSLAEALRVLAGFDIGRTHLKRDVPTSRGILQEHYSNKVLVMMNGVPAWNAVTGEASLERIDVRDVERVEVLKGPASVLYGTNAYAGAVNVILRVPEAEAGLDVHAGAGDKGAFHAGGRYTHGGARTKVFIAAGSRDEDGHDLLLTDERGERGHMREYRTASQYTASVEHGPHALFVNGFVSHESSFGIAADFDLGAGRDHVSRGYLASYAFQAKAGSKLNLRAGGSFDWQQRDFSRGRADLVRSSVEGYRASAFATARINASRALAFELGADYDYRCSLEYTNYDVLRDTVLAHNNMRDRELQELSGFGQMRLGHGRVKLLLGSRLTHNELYGANVSARGTLVFSIDASNSLKLIAGQSYRAPSFFELYFQTPMNTVYGNPDLAPETSDSLELAYVTSFKRVFAQALVYHARYKDKIFRVRRLPQHPIDRSLVYVNGAPFSANGVEVELKYQSHVGDAFVNYSFVDGDRGDEIDGNGHYNFRYVPPHSLSVGVARAIRRLELSAVLNLQSGVDGPQRRVDGWHSVDLNASYSHELGSFLLRHTLSAKNVGNDPEPIPEFVRRILNDIPSGNGRRVVFTIAVRPGGQD